MYLLCAATVCTMLYQLYSLFPPVKYSVQYGNDDVIDQKICIENQEYSIDRRLFRQKACGVYGRNIVREWVQAQFQLFRWNMQLRYWLENGWYKQMFYVHVYLPLVSIYESWTGRIQIPTLLRMSYPDYMKHVLSPQSYQNLAPLLTTDIVSSLIEAGWCPKYVPRGAPQCALEVCIAWQICLKGKLHFKLR